MEKRKNNIFEKNMSPERKNKTSLNLEFLEKEKKFAFLKELREQFPKAEIYLVGGAVRDLLLGRETKDYDFVIRKVPANEIEPFLQNRGTVDLVGNTFGVFKFIPKEDDSHNKIDIALPRKDFALGTGGYRDVEIQSNPDLAIKEDLSRRDFTINAMAVEIKDGKYKIVDPFNGQKDLKNKVIRAVGNPIDRFKEDYSRMLRALRFSCQLNFDIEKSTWKAIKNKIKGLNEIKRNVELSSRGSIAEPKVIEHRVVPYEVIAKEFLKSFYENPVRAYELYDESGAFEQLIPELLKMKNCPQPEQYHTEGDVWAHIRMALGKLNSEEFQKEFGSEPLSKELIIATLFHDVGKPYTLQTPEEHGVDRIRCNDHDKVGAKVLEQICERLKLSSPPKVGVDCEKVVWMVGHHLLIAHSKGVKLKARTIERYFFNPQNPGDDLIKLAFVDISSTISSSGKPDFTQYNSLLEQIKNFKKLSPTKKGLPKALLNGNEIMNEFNLKPGRKIGKLKDLVREEQLQGNIKTKQQAIKFLKKHI
ncbi:HD domain-containing protein [Patescibacteria group bacterium AH-259-L05]|nr:HD domain-containing protein [Patescibacteria group bacterium AH-259-L05]